MARAYKILGQRNPTANVLSTLYTVPASNSAIISSIVVSNLDETAGNGASFRIAANVSGVAVANGNYIAYTVKLTHAFNFCKGLNRTFFTNTLLNACKKLIFGSSPMVTIVRSSCI